MKLEETLSNEDYLKNVIHKVSILGPDIIPTIENTVSKYNGYAAKSVAFSLLNLAYYKKDKDITLEILHTIDNYSGVVGEYMLDNIVRFANIIQDKNTIINFARIMSLKKVVNTLNMYKSNASEIIVWNSLKLAKDMVLYKSEVSNLNYNLSDPTLQAFNFNNFIDIMSDQTIVDTIEKYKGENIKEVAKELVKIAFRTRSTGAVIAACNITKTVGLNAFEFLSSRDFITMSEEGLDKLINDTKSFDSVLPYLKSNGELPKPTKYNINKYQDIANEYLSSSYNINKKLNLNQILMLFSVNDHDRKDVINLVNNSIETNSKLYSLVSGGDPKLDIDKEKLSYLLLIAVTGSRDKNIEQEAFNFLSKIVGESVVRKAKHSFNSQYKAKLIGDISNYVKNGDVNSAINLLKDTKDENINDILSVAGYKDGDLIIAGKNTVLSTQSNNPLDYDSRLQIACVYLPSDYEGGIEAYCKDKRFNLIRYDINGKSLGSAICYLENGVFLVDSVEGHRTFRKPNVFSIVYQDLIDRAKENRAKQIIFNTTGRNETPQEFINYVKKINFNKGNTKMNLNTNGNLEAKRSFVSGYIVNL